jgi:hypothetical protein
MIYKWETDEERILRHMKTPLKKKLEMLRRMQEFNRKFLPKESLKIRQLLRKY